MSRSLSVDVSEGWRLVERLSRDIGVRVAGSVFEHTACALLVDEFESLGLRAEVQTFDFVGWNPGKGASLTCSLPDGSKQHLPTVQLGFTGATDEVEGQLVPAGRTQLVEGLIEWPRFAIQNEGKFLGYVAMFPDGPTRPFIRPERQAIVTLPTVIVGSDRFAEIAALIDSGAVILARLSTDGSYDVGLESSNIVIDLPGERSDEVVLVNGHYDTMPGTPGAGDNASGVGGCLALARRFLRRPRERTLRIGLWGAHEVGLLGSQAYALDLAERGRLDQITAAVSLDILSDGNRLGIWTGGRSMDEALRQSLRETTPTYPIETFPRLRGETDSWSFAERGIDTAMFLTLPYAHFHLQEDTTDNNDPGLFGFSVEVADRLVGRLMTTTASN